MIPSNRQFFNSKLQEAECTQINEITNQQIKSNTANQDSRFKSVEIKNLRETALPIRVTDIITITKNRREISQCENEIKKVEKELIATRLEMTAVQLQSKRLAGKSNDDASVKQSLSNLDQQFINLKEKELKQINLRFKSQQIITRLEEEIKKELGELPRISATQFESLVQVHEISHSSEKKENPLQLQFLDQSYTERTTSDPKTKENPEAFVKTYIELFEKKYAELGRPIDCKNIRSKIEAKIQQLEFSKNPIQKQRFLSQLNLQMAALENKNEINIIELTEDSSED